MDFKQLKDLLDSKTVSNSTSSILVVGFMIWFVQIAVIPEFRDFKKELIECINELHDEIAICITRSMQQERTQ